MFDPYRPKKAPKVRCTRCKKWKRVNLKVLGDSRLCSDCYRIMTDPDYLDALFDLDKEFPGVHDE
jgi:hypothetical protein